MILYFTVTGFMAPGARVDGSGFKLQHTDTLHGSGLRVQASGTGFGCRLRVQGSEFKLQQTFCCRCRDLSPQARSLDRKTSCQATSEDQTLRVESSEEVTRNQACAVVLHLTMLQILHHWRSSRPAQEI